jgi:tripartite-type tricarboxylate transporter receptor subunit TctC
MDTKKNRDYKGYSKKGLLMGVLSRLVEADANPAIDKFVQDQFEQLMKSPKFHELIERVSYQSDMPKDKALKVVMEKIANHADEIKKSKKKSAAQLELILR